MTANTIGLLSLLIKRSQTGEALWGFIPASLHAEKSIDVGLESALSMTCFFKNIHMSWFVFALQNEDPVIRPHLINLFPESITEKLYTHMQLDRSDLKLPNITRDFLLQHLTSLIKPKGLIDEAFLDESEMSIVLKLNMAQRIAMINVLGLMDLATALQGVLDRDIIEKVYSSLSPAHKTVLSYYTKQPSKRTSAFFELHRWNGSKDILKLLIQKRGLMFLSYAIEKEDASFIWHLLRRFDTARAKIILSNMNIKSSDARTTYFKKLVINSIKVLIK